VEWFKELCAGLRLEADLEAVEDLANPYLGYYPMHAELVTA
jgi:hypothetical protein